MSRLLDLDQLTADATLDLWSKVEEISRVRSLDPDLRARLEALLGKIPEPRLSEIREQLDQVHPALVLASYQDEFFTARFGTPNGPTFIGVAQRSSAS